jgi:hypothetical protein
MPMLSYYCLRSLALFDYFTIQVAVLLVITSEYSKEALMQIAMHFSAKISAGDGPVGSQYKDLTIISPTFV